MYLYRHRSILLKEFSRALDDRVVKFKLVRDSYRFFNGFIAYETNSLRDDLDLESVPMGRRYKMAMMLKEAQRGAESVGSETEYMDLFDLSYTGCRSCMACKRKGAER